MALAVPVTAGFPVANLISTQPPPADGWDPQPVTTGTMVTAPIPAIEGSFDQTQNQRGLVAKIVGRPVNAAPGMVTLSSDRLFRTGTATFRPAAAALITRAGSLVAAQADPSQPVSVAAFTDPAGTTALTITQARVMASQLADRLKQFTLVQAGAGSADPVAANTTSTGQAATQGRALNRRIELSFTPPDAGDVPPVSALATPSPGSLFHPRRPPRWRCPPCWRDLRSRAWPHRRELGPAQRRWNPVRTPASRRRSSRSRWTARPGSRRTAGRAGSAAGSPGH